ncbi:MAG: hypothetical protein ABR964_11540 [Tepidisphaeraceae bacterium]|jgi:phosphatidylglycerophosphate synthase
MVLATTAAILAAAVGAASLKILGVAVQMPAMLVALGAAIAASGLAAVPLSLARGGSPVTIMQAGLVGTVVHMLVLIITAAVVLLLRWPVGSSFVFWLYGFYLVTLIALVVGISRILYAARPDQKKALP